MVALSNDPVFRQAPPWKDFVRVRTVDLESVSVKHAIGPVSPDISVPIDRESQGELSTKQSAYQHLIRVPPTPVTGALQQGCAYQGE